jgi:hypothetical protein
MLRTRVTLKPGRPGTKTLVAEFGDRLLCVRYRYDEARQIRYKTAEVIVEEGPWTPTHPFAPTDVIELRIRPYEHTLRHAAHLLGAHPTPTTHTWTTTYAVARILHLTTRATRPTPTRIKRTA